MLKRRKLFTLFFSTRFLGMSACAMIEKPVAGDLGSCGAVLDKTTCKINCTDPDNYEVMGNDIMCDDSVLNGSQTCERMACFSFS
jgi:hypothetical protein